MSEIALDIGGANVKAVHARGAVQFVPFALWREPARLRAVLPEILAALPAADALRVTMTGELCDCFSSKSAGVAHILDHVEAAADGRPIRVWSTHGRFLTPDAARGDPLACAAANWHALGTWLAQRAGPGLAVAIDAGSTTTDILRIADGALEPRGFTDLERLASGALVYTGVRRTPLAALGPTLSWEGGVTGVAAELFADARDLYLLTGDLPEDPADRETADGAPATRAGAARRVARMVGADAEMLAPERIDALARAFAARQQGVIADALRAVAPEGPQRVLVSGTGELLAAAAAERAWPGLTAERLSATIGPRASGAACAHALLATPVSFTTPASFI